MVYIDTTLNMSIKISFIISEIPEDDLQGLREGYTIVAKMILTSEDELLFQSKKGDAIQVETENGNRLWCEIADLELMKNSDHTLVLFTLFKK